jgi:hypothetical protein
MFIISKNRSHSLHDIYCTRRIQNAELLRTRLTLTAYRYQRLTGMKHAYTFKTQHSYFEEIYKPPNLCPSRGVFIKHRLINTQMLLKLDKFCKPLNAGTAGF